MDLHTYKNISICSRYGGIELGIRNIIPIRTICYLELELYAAAILAKNMQKGFLDSAPIWTDLKTFNPNEWGLAGKVDILTGGFPCTPFSKAGKLLREDDPRNLWKPTRKLIENLGVSIIFLENVSGILEYNFHTIQPQLSEMGFEIEEGLFSASEEGASHLRERFFILGIHKTFSNASNKRLEGIRSPRYSKATQTIENLPQFPPAPSDHKQWEGLSEIVQKLEIQPTICRTHDGDSIGVDSRLRILGNGVVPATAEKAFKVLSNRLGYEINTSPAVELVNI